jgi:ribonucleoside-triphosphate reductase
LDAVKLIDQYIAQSDWRIKENANMNYSYAGMLGYVVSHATSEYALKKIFPSEAADAHKDCYIHIHDLSGLCNYCLGIDFEMFLMKGVTDDYGPPKHFDSALGQMANYVFLVSQQIAGAIAFNSVDILLAPYAKKDELTYKQIKQALQNYVCTVNIKGRIGYQSPFLNWQTDKTVPNRLKGRTPLIAGEEMDFTYDDCQWEIDAINRAVLEIIMEAPSVLAFPVLNVGITKEFNWDDKAAETIFTAMGRVGQPTINNYVNSDYDPDAVKSMCCSLRLDMSKIIKQTGGQFGAADNSGSLIVVTLNLSRYGYLSGGSEDILFGYLDLYSEIAFKAMVEKRKFVEERMKDGWYPAVKRFVDDFSHFFNTLGIIGMNEMLLNMGKGGIETDEGKRFSLQVLDYLNQKISDFQVEYKDFYGPNKGLLANLELVPGEGVTHRFARHDKERFPDIITANNTGDPYYTRGCWLPADQKYNVFFAAKHQEDLQDKFSGGANFQYYLEEPIHDWHSVRSLIKKLVYNTKLPFISLSPTIAVCPICGQLQDGRDYCEHKLSEEQIKDLKERGIEVIDS